jgi:hypothetical protein
MADDKSPLDDFIDGFQRGYSEQDRAISEDAARLEKKLTEGASTGLVESALNPFTWIRLLFK